MLKDALEKIRFIAQTLPDDDPDKLDMMNQEADYEALLDWCLRKYKENILFAQTCKEFQAKYKAREQSFTNKAQNFKDIAGMILDTANERSYKSAAGTIGYRATPVSVIVTDESKIPDKYFKVERKLMKADLKKDLQGGDIEGASLSNGGETLQVRV